MHTDLPEALSESRSRRLPARENGWSGHPRGFQLFNFSARNFGRIGTIGSREARDSCPQQCWRLATNAQSSLLQRAHTYLRNSSACNFLLHPCRSFGCDVHSVVCACSLTRMAHPAAATMAPAKEELSVTLKKAAWRALGGGLAGSAGTCQVHLC